MCGKNYFGKILLKNKLSFVKQYLIMIRLGLISANAPFKYSEPIKNFLQTSFDWLHDSKKLRQNVPDLMRIIFKLELLLAFIFTSWFDLGIKESGFFTLIYISFWMRYDEIWQMFIIIIALKEKKLNITVPVRNLYEKFHKNEIRGYFWSYIWNIITNRLFAYNKYK